MNTSNTTSKGKFSATIQPSQDYAENIISDGSCPEDTQSKLLKLTPEKCEGELSPAQQRIMDAQFITPHSCWGINE